MSKVLLLSRRLLTLFVVVGALSVHADAIMRSQAVSASAVAEYYVDEQGVRVELEMGLGSLEAFRNLMPDALYERMGFPEAALAERLQRFFSSDLAIFLEGQSLPGYVADIGPSRRVLRDPINGTPLPIQDTAPDVIRATLVYPFPEEVIPTQLSFTSPRGIDIGFVLYHKGVAVNDFRYLSPGYTLDLDWGDPWYTSFNSFQLKRQYSAPMSGFIYVEHFEVRKEIIVRPKDLQRWVDLGLAGKTEIPVALQADIKQKVGEFLALHHPVTIDGKPEDGILESVNFLERTLTSSRVIDPPEPLPLDSAIMGAIFVYPRTGLPQHVVMDWDLWDERVQRIPVSAVDQAGPLPSFLEQDWRLLEWKNFLNNPELPTLAEVQLPIKGWRILLRTLLPFLLALLIAAAIWFVLTSRRGSPVTLPALATLALLAGTAVAYQYGAGNKPDSDRARDIVGDLLQNIYRAFDYRDEGDIYDVLAMSVDGDLLTDIFLETKRSLVLANQGGAAAKVKNIQLESLEVLPDDRDNSFSVEANWTVHGSVGHWGHIHQRSNRYLARLRVAVDDERWKLQDMQVLQEERL